MMMMTVQDEEMEQGEVPSQAPLDTGWADGWDPVAASGDPLAVDAWLEAPPARSLRALSPRPWPTENARVFSSLPR